MIAPAPTSSTDVDRVIDEQAREVWLNGMTLAQMLTLIDESVTRGECLPERAVETMRTRPEAMRTLRAFIWPKMLQERAARKIVTHDIQEPQPSALKTSDTKTAQPPPAKSTPPPAKPPTTTPPKAPATPPPPADTRTMQQKNRDRLYVDIAAGRPSSLSLGEHIAASMQVEQDAMSKHGVGPLDHEADATWRRCWEFVRHVKAHPTMTQLSARDALFLVEDIMRHWPITDEMEDIVVNIIPSRNGRLPKKSSPEYLDLVWAGWLGVDRETAATAFLSCWDRVRCLPGYGPVDYAIQRATAVPINWLANNLSIDTAGYRRFLSVAGWLQVTAGNANIVLPVHLLSKKLKTTTMSVSRYRTAALADKYLIFAKAHRWHSKGGSANAATEYRFNVGLVPVLKQAAQAGTVEAFGEATP
ncbi:MAG: hypothetical protein NTW19_02735 [Planctomycetota bacterium]|nr:hypothetical protein [Planctomycetota bacterium]